MSIPKSIFSIWIGGPMPENLRRFSAKMESINRNFRYRLCGDELLDQYKADPYVKTMLERKTKLAFVADRLRCLVLRDEGGIYVDADAEPVKSFSALNHILERPDVDFVTGMRSPFRKGVALHRGVSFVDNTCMASAKNGRMINRLLALWTPKTVVCNGYNCGIEILNSADHDTVLLRAAYFYSEVPCPEAIFYHDNQNLGSWINQPV